MTDVSKLSLTPPHTDSFIVITRHKLITLMILVWLSIGILYFTVIRHWI